ncbi:MAG: hypothetical protein K6F73_08405 [Lachnospiraceae bacterium]|nr:hypothetical protein [Lachnospiraceae bacterium]
MLKKVMMTISGVMLAGVIFCASSVDTKAALPCTYDIINDANGDINQANAMYTQSKAKEAEYLAALNAIKANPGAYTQLEYEQAVFNYNNQVNISQWWLTNLNNAKAYLTNITGRGAFEDKFAANRAALADLTTLGAAKTDAQGAANIANGVLMQIADVEKAIAGYQLQVAANPSLQKQINDLTARLATLKADYAAKAAIAAQKAELYNTYLKTLNYQGYSVGFENYQFNREYQRDNLNWDPKGYY